MTDLMIDTRETASEPKFEHLVGLEPDPRSRAHHLEFCDFAERRIEAKRLIENGYMQELHAHAEKYAHMSQAPSWAEGERAEIVGRIERIQREIAGLNAAIMWSNEFMN